MGRLRFFAVRVAAGFLVDDFGGVDLGGALAGAV
jgi:hypothetical protein